MFLRGKLAGLVLIITVLTTIFFLHQKLNNPQIKGEVKEPDHILVFLGDSMTENLGNFDELRVNLKKYYPNKEFLLLNYGYGSTNILSVPERLEKQTTHSGRIFEAINNIPFDYIFIESFGNNPLSDLPITEGLQKQTETLDKIILSITRTHPRESIIFITTVSPSRSRYGENVVNLSPQERGRWADERISYIKNHINYARTRGFPIIDIYSASLNPKGDGNIDYISSADFIHPSPTGIIFISQKIADFIYENKLIN